MCPYEEFLALKRENELAEIFKQEKYDFEQREAVKWQHLVIFREEREERMWWLLSKRKPASILASYMVPFWIGHPKILINKYTDGVPELDLAGLSSAQITIDLFLSHTEPSPF